MARIRPDRPNRPASPGGRRGSAAASVLPPTGSSRAFIPLLIFAAFAVVFAGRLVYLQVVKAPEYSAMASAARTSDIETTPRRGTIYDRNGNVLATSVDATTVYANPSEVTDAAGAAAQLASILGGEAASYQEKLSQGESTFVYLKRKADVDAAARVEELGLDGVYFIEDTRREYPYGRIGGQVVGFCNIDGEGIAGLELYYDDILKGTPGRLVAERGEYGIPIPGGVKEETAAVDGQDIMISLDIQLQDTVEQRLEQCKAELGGESANAVVMDGGTGEIYAAASLPLFNPADTSVVEEGATTLRCITSAIEPGSVFKTVSAMALLETGSMAPDDELFCPAEIEADEYTVSDAHDRDDQTMTLRDIIDNSSNVGISLATEAMGFDKLYEKILAYNLNDATGVDYPGEASGYLADQADWSKIQSYNVSFGQGISVTPLQITRFYGALVNDGVECTPHFLIALPQSGERPVYETEEVVQDKEAVPTMVDMLKTVVTDGTGTSAAIDGYSVAGKTSTAEVAADDGGYKKGVYNLAFTGFIADSSSQLVCFVGANEVAWQASVAPVFKDIMTAAIDRFRIQPE